MIASVLVFIDNEFIRAFRSNMAEWRNEALFICAKYNRDDVRYPAVRRVEVCGRYVVTLSRLIDHVVRLGI